MVAGRTRSAKAYAEQLYQKLYPMRENVFRLGLWGFITEKIKNG
jgi:hypothetical protein